MSWPLRMARGAPCSATGCKVFVQGSMRRRFLVPALGGQLRLRNQRRAARPRDCFSEWAGILPACGSVAQIRAEACGQLWGMAAELSRRIVERPGEQYAFTDRLGADQASCRGRSWRRSDCESRRISCDTTKRGWLVGRKGIYRHGLPVRFLFEVSPVS